MPSIDIAKLVQESVANAAINVENDENTQHGIDIDALQSKLAGVVSEGIATKNKEKTLGKNPAKKPIDANPGEGLPKRFKGGPGGSDDAKVAQAKKGAIAKSAGSGVALGGAIGAAGGLAYGIKKKLDSQSSVSGKAANLVAKSKEYAGDAKSAAKSAAGGVMDKIKEHPKGAMAAAGAAGLVGAGLAARKLWKSRQNKK